MASITIPTMTLDEFERSLLRAGRVNGPALLFDAWFGKQISREILAATIGMVWSAAEYPLPSLGQQTWRELFDAAGYTVDGKPADRPLGSTRLYRGSPPGLRRRWAWTADRGLAERFAHDLLRGRLPGKVYMIDAPPESLLCMENGREESEYVVDTRGLKMREAEDRD